MIQNFARFFGKKNSDSKYAYDSEYDDSDSEAEDYFMDESYMDNDESEDEFFD